MGSELAGSRADLSTQTAKAAAIEAAFGYRGDVTLELADGAAVTGYLFDRTASSCRLLVAGSDDPVTVDLGSVVGLVHAAADPAAGKSWQAWLEKVAQAEAEGKIAELYPDESA